MDRHDLSDRASLESALRDLEARHELVFQSAPGAMCVFDADTFQILAVNEAAIAQYGYTREEFLAMKTRDVRPPGGRAGYWRVEAAIRAGHEVHTVVQHARRDGSVIEVEIRSSTLPGGTGRLRLALLTDITEHRRGADAARLLDRANALLMASLDPATLCRNLATVAVPAVCEWCIVYRVSADGIVPCGYAHANPLEQAAVGELFQARATLRPGSGATRAVQTGTLVLENAQASEMQARLTPMEAALYHLLGTHEILYVPVTTGGKTLAVLECARVGKRAPYDECGRALAIALTDRAALAMDNAATHARLLEQVHRTERAPAAVGNREDQGWRWVVENIPDCYLRLSRDWTLTYANGNAVQLLGRPRDEVVGQNIWTLFPSAVGTIFEQQYRLAMAERRAITFEAYYGGLDMWFEVTVRPEGDGLALFFRDVTTHRHALQALESSEDSYRDFLDSATDLIHMLAPDGRVLFANRAWRTTLGYSEEEVRTLNIMDVIAPEHRQVARETFEQCLSGAELPEGEMVMLSKDGRRLVIRGHANCRFVDGRPVSTRAIYRDVTAQVEAHQLLAQAKRTEAASARAKTAFLDRMSHEMRTPLTAVIGFASILEANRAGRLGEREVDFARRIGNQGRSLLAIVEDVLSYAEIESRRVSLLVAPIDLSALIREVCALYDDAAAANQVTLLVDLPVQAILHQTDASVLRRVLRYLLSDAVSRSGAQRVRVAVLTDVSGSTAQEITVETQFRDGTVLPAQEADPSAALELGLSIGLSLAQMLGYHIDVERRGDGTQVRTLRLRSAPHSDGRDAGESAKTLHALLEASPLPIIAFEPDWTVRLWNKAAQNLLGYSPAEIIEHRLALLPPEDEPAFRELLRVALDQEHGVTDAPAVHLHRDGSRLDVSLALAALRAPDGRLRGFLSIVTDVTARKRMEAELRQAQKMEVVGRLSGGIAHDFNNLLTVISAHAQFLLADVAADDPITTDARAILDATERATALTRQLLTFSRREAPQRRNVDLNRKLMNTERMLRHILGSHVEFVTVPAHDPVVVYADPAQMEQVLMNLVLNARDAMPRGGALVVEVAAERDAAVVEGQPGPCFARVTVSDTGIGMDAETRKRVFEPFFTTKPEGRGTGLGLATVHDIVMQSGGTIAVESEVGRGTIFTIRLPLVAEESGGWQSTKALPSARGTETVLLVEDQEAVRAVAARVLRGRGYTVLLARHGNDALEIVEARGAEINLLLTDLVMPEMPGTEVAARVKEAAPGIRVLFMSGYSETPFGMSPGDKTIPLIRKPFTAEELSQAVRNALDAA